jgi:hypothetical protein
MSGENRGPWYLLTGLVLGILAGLLYAWLISPVQYTNTAPASLRGDFKDQYRTLIAVAYLSNTDFARAKARLELLEDPDVVSALSLQAQLARQQGRPESEISALTALALALSGSPIAPTAPPSPSAAPTREGSPTPTLTQVVSLLTTPSPTAETGTTAQTPTPSLTPLPSRTPTPTPGAAFVLQDQALVCTPGTASLIQVEALDAAGQPIPGVEVIVTWDAGEDHFYTGLKLEISPGYADFTLEPGETYQVRLSEDGELISGLSANECETDTGERYWGSWKLIFQQP